MSEHKFKVGQAVEYHSSRWLYAPHGTYIVTAELPERDGEFAYHVRSAKEEHERMARESELSAVADDGDAPSAPVHKKRGKYGG
jgi:hypothetical protein